LHHSLTVGHTIAPLSDSRSQNRKPQTPVIYEYTKNNSEEMAAIGRIRFNEIAITVKTTVRAAYVTVLCVFFPHETPVRPM
jgi:hypothetical protein